MLVNDVKSQRLLLDRHSVMARLSAAGVRVPVSFVVDHTNEAEAALFEEADNHIKVHIPPIFDFLFDFANEFYSVLSSSVSFVVNC